MQDKKTLFFKGVTTYFIKMKRKCCPIFSGLRFYLYIYRAKRTGMKKNDWKERLGVTYSTNPDYQYQFQDDTEVGTLPKEKQLLRIALDKRNRGGKTVTLITGFRGTDDDLTALGKLLKVKCGVGGTVKDGDIIIQGDFRQKIVDILIKEGYTKSRVIG